MRFGFALDFGVPSQQSTLTMFTLTEVSGRSRLNGTEDFTVAEGIAECWNRLGV